MVPLRTKCSSALLAAVLIFASGCHKQSTELSPEQSETKEAFDRDSRRLELEREQL